jgi:hypothetical protein
MQFKNLYKTQTPIYVTEMKYVFSIAFIIILNYIHHTAGYNFFFSISGDTTVASCSSIKNTSPSIPFQHGKLKFSYYTEGYRQLKNHAERAYEKNSIILAQFYIHKTLQ